MTDKIINLRALVEKTPDADLLREMIGFAADRLMQLEAGVATGADYSEKSHSGRRTVADHRSLAQGFWGGVATRHDGGGISSENIQLNVRRGPICTRVRTPNAGPVAPSSAFAASFVLWVGARFVETVDSAIFPTKEDRAWLRQH